MRAESSPETIRPAAADIINSIDEYIAELQKQHEAEKAAPGSCRRAGATDRNPYGLAEKAAAIAEKYEALPTQEKIGVIAQAFGGTAGQD